MSDKPNTLLTPSRLKIVDLICEGAGPLGFVGGDIYLENRSISHIARTHYAWIREMGWAPDQTGMRPLESLMLVVSEVGEAANEVRGEKPTDQYGKELADIVLRVAAIAEHEGIDLEAAILAKMAANREKGARGRTK